MSRPDVFVLALRLLACLAIIIAVPLMWRLMLWLPWQLDCVLATSAAFAFAYTFEREESQ
jgi:hypothetical protein